MAHHFVSVDRSTPFLLPPSLQEWLPEGHLARFVVEVVEQLDLSELEAAYAGRGSKAYHPAMMLSLLFYGRTGLWADQRDDGLPAVYGSRLRKGERRVDAGDDGLQYSAIISTSAQ